MNSEDIQILIALTNTEIAVLNAEVTHYEGLGNHGVGLLYDPKSIYRENGPIDILTKEAIKRGLIK